MKRSTICVMLVAANAWSLGLTACATKERVVVKTVPIPVSQPCVSKDQVGEPFKMTAPDVLARMNPDERMKTAYAEWLGANARLTVLEPIARICSE